MPRRSPLPIVALAASLVAAGCGAWNPKPNVNVRSIPLELAFGRDVEKELRAPSIVEALVEAGALEPEPTPRPKRTKQFEPTGPACPPPDPFRLKPLNPAAVSNFTTDDDFQDKFKPTEGQYLTAITYTFEGLNLGTSGPVVVSGFSRLRLKNVKRELPTGYSYDLVDLATGNGWRLRVNPDDGLPTSPGGIYLQGLYLGSEGDGVLLRVNPELKLIDYPVLNGDTQRAAGLAGAGATAQAPVTSEAKVLGQEWFFACDQPVDGWKIQWRVNLLLEPIEVSYVGSFWMATQFGGWPVKADQHYTLHDRRLDVTNRRNLEAIGADVSTAQRGVAAMRTTVDDIAKRYQGRRDEDGKRIQGYVNDLRDDLTVLQRGLSEAATKTQQSLATYRPGPDYRVTLDKLVEILAHLGPVLLNVTALSGVAGSVRDDTLARNDRAEISGYFDQIADTATFIRNDLERSGNLLEIGAAYWILSQDPV